MRRTTSLIASITVATLAGGAMPAISSAAKQPHARSLHLIVKDFKYTQVDTPAANGSSTPVAGDLLVFSATVTNDAGVEMGSLENSCTVTVGGTNWRSLWRSIGLAPC
ncbi:MAG: hypothetical protein ACLQBY_15800 [Solirubrobacteraceae bacterium]